MMKHEDVYRAAIAKWGEQAQLDQAVEECAELIATIKHFRRGKVGLAEVIDELADVYLMVGQLTYMFGEAEVMASVDLKLAKVARLMADGAPPAFKE